MEEKHNNDIKNLHLLESEALAGRWMTYVFTIVEKLHDKVEANTLQVQKEREEFFRLLVELKDKINEQIIVLSKEQSLELTKLDDKFIELVDGIVLKFEIINKNVSNDITNCSEEKNNYLSNVKEEFQKEIKSLKNDQSIFNVSLTKVNTKLGVYVALIALATSTTFGVLATTLVVIFREAILKWLGQ